MKINFKRTISIISIKLFALSSLFVNINQNQAYSFEVKESKSFSSKKGVLSLENYLDNSPENGYILGTGDQIRITISPNIPSIDVVVNPNGTIAVPELNRIYVSGLTISELENQLKKKYIAYISRPFVKIDLISPKPIRVYLKGELKMPGLYTIAVSNPNIDTIEVKNNTTDKVKDNKSIFYPTVFDAIQKAGGITSFSDISNITLRRRNPISNGGGYIVTSLDFLDLIISGDLSQNIQIFDGDVITIKKATTEVTGQISKKIKNNINPKYMEVFVSGKVSDPGKKNVNTSASLNDAIYMAGSSKGIKGKIILTRYNSDGSVNTKKIRFSPNSVRGGKRNPYLLPGDIIFVGEGFLGATSNLLNDIFSPFIGIYSFKKITE
tara:strand:- start:119 stop:1261 length:1143 start_codon:yes stop_codon:yes gene_type:complete